MEYPFEQSRRESRKRRRLSERRRVFSRIGLSSEQRRLEVNRESGGASGRITTGAQQGSLSSPDQSSWSGSAPQLDPNGFSVAEATLNWLPRSDSPSLPGSAGEQSVKVSLKIQFHISIAPENEPLIVLDGPLVGGGCQSASSSSGGDSFRARRQLERLSRHNSSSTKRRQQLLALHRQAALESPLVTEKPLLTTATSNLIEQRSSKVTNTSTRQHIYFKRDGQRFNHEFTLKLAVNRTYRCLLKVRPLLPLQAISVQGQQVLFADCSEAAAALSLAASERPATTSSGSLQSLADHRSSKLHFHDNNPQVTLSGHRPSTATVMGARRARASSSSSSCGNQQQHKLRQEQQSQMMRQFAHSSAASSNPHLVGGQLIYMFDWSANQFQVNKNKARTQLLTHLRFKNGQALILPMQVKFYQSECRQHLNWGSQLHFIDYDCQIDALGQIHLDRIHYY